MNDHPITLWLLNLGSAGSIIASILGFLPPLAALVALVWYFIQIGESVTVQRWITGRRVRKLARLKARAIMLEAKMRRPETPPPAAFDL